VIWSSGLAFRSGNGEAFLYDTLSADDRDHEYSDRMGVYLALGTVSLLAGGVLGGVLAAVTTLQIAILAALVPLLFAMPVMFLMDEPPQRHVRIEMSLLGTLRTGVSTVWHDRPLRSIVLLQIGLQAVSPAFFLLSQPFLDQHGVSLALFGVVAIPIHLARIGAGLYSGRLTRRIGLPSVLALCIACAVAGLLCLATVDSVWAVGGLAVAMAAVGISMPAIGAYINERTESQVRATVLSVAPLGISLVMGAMSATAGTLASTSLRLSFGAMAVAILLFAGANYLSWLAANGRMRSTETRVVEV
jgi:MFS family permease